jgi:hypothetical protein
MDCGSKHTDGRAVATRNSKINLLDIGSGGISGCNDGETMSEEGHM